MYDIIVIGGAVGMTAAENGAKVLHIEKNDRIGKNSR